MSSSLQARLFRQMPSLFPLPLFFYILLDLQIKVSLPLLNSDSSVFLYSRADLTQVPYTTLDRLLLHVNHSSKTCKISQHFATYILCLLGRYQFIRKIWRFFKTYFKLIFVFDTCTHVKLYSLCLVIVYLMESVYGMKTSLTIEQNKFVLRRNQKWSFHDPE